MITIFKPDQKLVKCVHLLYLKRYFMEIKVKVCQVFPLVMTMVVIMVLDMTLEVSNEQLFLQG